MTIRLPYAYVQKLHLTKTAVPGQKYEDLEGNFYYGSSDKRIRDFIVTSTGTGLTPSGVTPGTYGDVSDIPQVTVDINGIVTSISNIPVIIPPSFITGISDTSTIDLTETLGILTADFHSMNISQFTNDSGYITSIPAQPDASDIVKGVTKLSVAPVSTTNPIAVGDNDPRNTNARTPTAHAASHTNGTDDIQNATTSQKGLLTNTDWNTFNGKEPSFSTLPISKGGTNSNSALSNNRIIQSSGGAMVEAAAITAAKALKSDANGIPVHFDTTTEPSLTELGYVKGTTSSIQTQLNGKVVTRTITYDIDGFGAILSTGNTTYYTFVGSGTITAWNIVATGASPTCTIDIWKVATGTVLPTVSNTIIGGGGSKPALSTGNAIHSTTTTGWATVAVSANDIFGFNLDAITNATKITLTIEITQ